MVRYRAEQPFSLFVASMQSQACKDGYRRLQVTNQGWTMLMKPVLLGFAIGFLAFGFLV
jgi:hypothetical protein